jgi:hypothetical protein
MSVVGPDEAVQIAMKEVVRLGCHIAQDEPQVIYKQRHMRLGTNRSGWLVIFRLNVPEGFEPDRLHVEVYETDGEVHVQAIL